MAGRPKGGGGWIWVWIALSASGPGRRPGNRIPDGRRFNGVPESERAAIHDARGRHAVNAGANDAAADEDPTLGGDKMHVSVRAR